MNPSTRHAKSCRGSLAAANTGIDVLVDAGTQRVASSLTERRVSTVVAHLDSGKPLIDLLVCRFTYHGADVWRGEVIAGRILLNGVPALPEKPLSAGDRIEYLVPPRPEPPVDTRFRVAYQDSALLVVDKPAHLPCHPAGPFFRNTLWSLLRATGGLDHVEFVNRLDRETSGLVLVARTPGAARHCRRQFARRSPEKRYSVVVEGRFPAELDATGYLMPDPGSFVRKKRMFRPCPEPVIAPEAGWEWAETAFVRRSTGGAMTLLEARPRTGRQHQIRATLASLGYPVVGDKLYGVDETMYLRFAGEGLTAADRLRLRLERQALHAGFLSLEHPVTRCPVTFEVPLPSDMLALVSGWES